MGVDITLVQGKADALAKAIALAEGGLKEGTLPYRIHNPGDLELGDRGWGIAAAKTIYLKADWTADLSDKTDGCSALRRECLAILSGASHTFEPSWNLLEFAQKWTGGDNPESWAKIVAGHLEIETDTILATYAEAA